MSHLKERKEKICLNCNAAVYGRFCHVCGQENIEVEESFWQLTIHLIADIFHYDGKFFRTIKYLLFKPGFLTRAYITGKRTSYLHPVRLYLFTSAVFFLLFFTFFYNQNKDALVKEKKSKRNKIETVASFNKEITEIKLNFIKMRNKTSYKYIVADLDELINEANSDSIFVSKDSAYIPKVDFNKYKFNPVNFYDTAYSNVKQYDSIQNKLPKDSKDNFLVKYMQHKLLRIQETTKGSPENQFMDKLNDGFMHKFPQLLFVYLPFFALSLLLLYARRNRYFYVNHIVFALHLFCGFFILILFLLFSKSTLKYFDLKPLPIIFLGMYLLFIYKSFRNFYQQSRFKTIFKLILLFFINAIISIFLVSLFFLISALNIS